MSSRTDPRAAVPAALLLLCLSANPVLAAVQCPAVWEGHPLRAKEPVGLYQGDPADNALQAPAGTFKGPNGLYNVWTFRGGGAGFSLACRYEGTQSQVYARLPADARSCRQDIAARTFTCQ